MRKLRKNYAKSRENKAKITTSWEILNYAKITQITRKICKSQKTRRLSPTRTLLRVWTGQELALNHVSDPSRAKLQVGAAMAPMIRVWEPARPTRLLTDASNSQCPRSFASDRRGCHEPELVHWKLKLKLEAHH